MNDKEKRGTRMRSPVQSVYNRQVAKCLDDIADVMELPNVVINRIKQAIEYTCKDVDKIKTRNPNGVHNEATDINGNK